jgi:hypothetical protein
MTAARHKTLDGIVALLEAQGVTIEELHRTSREPRSRWAA